MGRPRLIAIGTAVGLVVGLTSASASAQILGGTQLVDRVDPIARLEEQLINRLRAVQPEQQAYVRYIVELVENRKLETRLVIALERYALRRNPHYPFPFFERALNFEARKRGLALRDLEHFQSTANAPPRPPRLR